MLNHLKTKGFETFNPTNRSLFGKNYGVRWLKPPFKVPVPSFFFSRAAGRVRWAAVNANLVG